MSQIYSNPCAEGSGKVCIIDGEIAGYGAQYFIQLIVVGVSLIMALLLMFPKPIIVNAQNKAAKKKREAIQAEQMESEIMEPLNRDSLDEGPIQSQKKSQKHDHDDHHDEGFGELMIHQLIETIEFVLGMISNTASYLRLWALSLAHSQLASTFLDLFMRNYWGEASFGMAIAIAVIGWVVLFGVTTAVLLLMDAMECFLHTLRLHWVEFQNKFFKGDGLKYMSFNFEEREELNFAVE